MIAALTGFMASGKSTFGKAAADTLGVRFIDLDREIISRYGTMGEIFAKGGESFFRRIEAEMLRETSADTGNIILSLGGGTILSAENRKWLKENCKTIWLDTSWEIILSELGNSERPTIKERSEEQIKEMYISRRPLYRSVADMVVIIDSFDWEIAISDLTEAVRTTLSL